MILIEYRIRAGDRAAFLDAITRLSEARRRDGAYAWGITEDTADPERIVEWFMVESWAEHLRQHKRVSRADADLQREATQFHLGPDAPRVQHFLNLRAGPS
jgi:quinol monooxygenase YgiN